jgi:hypothetical protein
MGERWDPRWVGIWWGLLAIIPFIAYLVIVATVQAGGPPAERELTGPATAHAVAERLTPPTTTVWADPCAELTHYRQLVGLPAELDRIGYRESRCLNRDDVRTWCCHGWWQLYINLHLQDHRLAPRYAACGITSPDDVNSNTPQDKYRQACAARALYDVQGLNAWAATR